MIAPLAPLALLCAAVLFGIAACSYTYRHTVRNLFASVCCVDAELTTVVRLAAGCASIACAIGAARGFL